MRRREFISLIGSTAAAWPLAARAQQPPLPVVALINLRSAEASVRLANAFRKGLNEAGWVEGQNVTVEYNWLDGRFDRVSSVIADIVRRRVAVIATPGYHLRSPGGQSGNHNNTHRVRRRRRPRQARPRRQPRSAGRKYDGLQLSPR